MTQHKDETKQSKFTSRENHGARASSQWAENVDREDGVGGVMQKHSTLEGRSLNINPRALRAPDLLSEPLLSHGCSAEHVHGNFAKVTEMRPLQRLAAASADSGGARLRGGGTSLRGNRAG